MSTEPVQTEARDPTFEVRVGGADQLVSSIGTRLRMQSLETLGERRACRDTDGAAQSWRRRSKVRRTCHRRRGQNVVHPLERGRNAR